MKVFNLSVKINEQEQLEAVFPFYVQSGLAGRQTDFCVRKNTASCVLSIPKRFPVLKTTCPSQGAEKTSEVCFYVNLERVNYGREQ